MASDGRDATRPVQSEKEKGEPPSGSYRVIDSPSSWVTEPQLEAGRLGAFVQLRFSAFAGSDLERLPGPLASAARYLREHYDMRDHTRTGVPTRQVSATTSSTEIGRASCRERVQIS